MAGKCQDGKDVDSGSPEGKGGTNNSRVPPPGDEAYRCSEGGVGGSQRQGESEIF